MGPYAFSADRTPVLLAPMSGVTDAPFRRQASLFGASAVITEMIAGEDLAAGQRDALQRIERPDVDAPFVVQLVGREVEPLRLGACFARAAGADVIDINMGCPARRVTGGLSGSALMRDLDRAEQLIQGVLDGAEDVPVTLKMRLGWDQKSKNAPELAHIAQRLGVTLVTVHGRTRQDFYDGEADWLAIRDVVDAVAIPVIANGDITDVCSAKLALAQSGAAGVMVGRAATGLAWLPSAIEESLSSGKPLREPDIATQIDSLMAQARDSVELYGERTGMRVIRKHLAGAFDHWARSSGPDMARKLQSLKKNACETNVLPELADTLGKTQHLEMEVAA